MRSSAGHLETPYVPRPNRDVVDFVVRLPRAIHLALRVAAAARHLTMADVVREALLRSLPNSPTSLPSPPANPPHSAGGA